jgi:hypothetical protein
VVEGEADGCCGVDEDRVGSVGGCACGQLSLR